MENTKKMDSKPGNDLENYFTNNTNLLIHKWMHYFDVYDRHFSKYRGKDIVLVEVGVFQGGSLQMWRDYFGPGAKIYGIDNNKKCAQLDVGENVEIIIGSQEDRHFLRELKAKLPKIDILIDDGGHTMNQQIVTYEELFDHVKDDGVYLCEDLHTSYWSKWGGGYRNPKSFIEYSKAFIDYINAYHSKTPELGVNDFTKSVGSIHYYDSILVLEKKKRSKPVSKKSGGVKRQ